jgi:hypothetical protein
MFAYLKDFPWCIQVKPNKRSQGLLRACREHWLSILLRRPPITFLIITLLFLQLFLELSIAW